MMAILWRMALALAVAVIHTTLTPWMMPALRGYDPMLVLVVVLGFSDSMGRGLATAAWAGILMDNLSGASFGFHLSLYIWGIVGVRAGRRFLYALNRLLPPLLVVVLVVAQNVVILLLTPLVAGERWALVVAGQALVAFLTAPLLLDLIGAVIDAGDRWIRALSGGHREPLIPPRAGGDLR